MQQLFKISKLQGHNYTFSTKAKDAKKKQKKQNKSKTKQNKTKKTNTCKLFIVSPPFPKKQE